MSPCNLVGWGIRGLFVKSLWKGYRGSLETLSETFKSETCETYETGEPAQYLSVVRLLYLSQISLPLPPSSGGSQPVQLALQGV